MTILSFFSSKQIQNTFYSSRYVPPMLPHIDSKGKVSTLLSVDLNQRKLLTVWVIKWVIFFCFLTFWWQNQRFFLSILMKWEKILERSYFTLNTSIAILRNGQQKFILKIFKKTNIYAIHSVIAFLQYMQITEFISLVRKSLFRFCWATK